MKFSLRLSARYPRNNWKRAELDCLGGYPTDTHPWTPRKTPHYHNY